MSSNRPTIDRRETLALLSTGAASLCVGAAAAAQGHRPPDKVPASTRAAEATASSAAGATMALASFAAGLTAEMLSSDYKALQKAYVLDNVAAMLAGSVQPVHKLVDRMVEAAMGPGEAEPLRSGRTSLSGAALLDGLSAADFEYEHVIQNAHPSSATFPALLLLASQRNLPGTDFIAAMAAAYELAIRIGNACTPAVEHDRGFHNPGVNGTLAAAAGCARLLQADAVTIASAMGLAGSSSAGLLAFVDTGAMTKRLHPARSAQLGLECALMAQAGVQGPTTVLENRYGLLHAFSPEPDPSQLLTGLGTVWKSQSMIVKLAPVHAYALFYVHALNEARSKGVTWRAQDISAVQVRGSSAAFGARNSDTNPTSLVAAQYSVPFCVAVAVARDLRNPLQVNESALGDQEVVRIMRLLEFKSVNSDPKQLGGEIIITAAGKPIVIDASKYPGYPGSAGYVSSISGKLDQVLSALDIRRHAAELRDAVDGIATKNGPATLRRAMLTAARAAKGL